MPFWRTLLSKGAADAHFLFCKTMSKRKRGLDVRSVSEQLAESMGYELVDAAFEKEGPGMYLRFYIDKAEGITLDDCEAFHRKVQPLVEDADYDFLEVCSPGIDRPIKTAKDAQKALGQQVEIKLYKPLNGRKELSGTLVSFDSEHYALDLGQERVEVPIKAIAVAKRTINVEEVLEAQEENTEDNAHEQPEA